MLFVYKSNRSVIYIYDIDEMYDSGRQNYSWELQDSWVQTDKWNCFPACL